MYSVKEKEEVIKMFKQNEDINTISLKSNVSKSTLYCWKKELDIIKEAKKLARKDKYKEAEDKINELTSKNSQILRLSSLVTIARIEKDIKKEKELLKQLLEIDSNNVKAMSSLIRIAREEGNTEEEKRLLNRQLEVNPDNIIAMLGLAKIEREEGNIEEEKRWLNRILELEPDNTIAMSSLERIVRKKGNKEKANEWRERANDIKEKQIGNTDDIERQMMEETREINVDNEVGKIRDKIYKSSNILDELEEIKKDIDELEDRTVAEIILAEIYSITGFGERAYKSLQRYKKGQKELLSKDDLKSINKAIELAKNSRDCKVKLKWNVLHEEIERRNSSDKKENEHNRDER